MRVTPLPYQPDSARLFEAIAAEEWAVFLDSGRPWTTAGRWDILAARPYATLVTRSGVTRIETRHGHRTSRRDPLLLLREALAPAAIETLFPFAGGAIGYFGYDLARTLGLLPASAESPAAMPDMAVGLYDWAMVVDHVERSTHLIGAGRDAATDRYWGEWVARFSHPGPVAAGPWKVATTPHPVMSPAAYRRAFARIQAYIHAGDCYQVNLTQRYMAQVSGDRWGLYGCLRRANPAPYSAYLNYPFGQVLSTSPERFLALRAGQVTSHPIKGTRARLAEAEADRRQAEALLASAKDRAENLMIVDLLRNDLGKVCHTGSVDVPALFQLESFAGVHHLVSTVSGRLAPGRDALDLLRACFPGGSITGAPKRRAMAIIDELEADRRGLYCGAIGYIGFTGDMDLNIVIRTLVSSGDTLHFGVGGGIVADSRVEAEYQECLDKAAPFMRLLTPGDGGRD